MEKQLYLRYLLFSPKKFSQVHLKLLCSTYFKCFNHIIFQMKHFKFTNLSLNHHFQSRFNLQLPGNSSLGFIFGIVVLLLQKQNDSSEERNIKFHENICAKGFYTDGKSCYMRRNTHLQQYKFPGTSLFSFLL